MPMPSLLGVLVLHKFACIDSEVRDNLVFAVLLWIDQTFLLASAGSSVSWSCHLFSDVCLRVCTHNVFVWRVIVLPCCVSIAAGVILA